MLGDRIESRRGHQFATAIRAASSSTLSFEYFLAMSEDEDAAAKEYPLYRSRQEFYNRA